jgi:DNA-directed RNA polymerase subunit K/omega
LFLNGGAAVSFAASAELDPPNIDHDGAENDELPLQPAMIEIAQINVPPTIDRKMFDFFSD